ncbi:RNA-binding cell elongation regulator Jag/EloR [Gemella bergeri]
MKKEYIYEEKTVDEAIKKGLAELNLVEDKVKIEVIEGGANGIFGLFKKNAKVKLTPLELENTDVLEKTTEKVKENIEIEEKEGSKEEKILTDEKTEKKEKREDYIIKNKEKIVNYLTNIVKAMGYPDVNVDFKEEGNRHFTLNIKTEENTSLIIGKRGATLNSLQFLVNNYAKKFSSHFFRITVDCDDYRKTRQKTLEELALNLAKKSKKTGRPVELEPMTSVERKIIHNALTGIKNVETESRGEEPFRYLVITAR